MISESSQPSTTLSEPGVLTLSPAPGVNRFWQIALALLCLTGFLLISRVLDVTHAHGMPVLLGLLGITLALSRRALVFWKFGAGRVLPFLVGWIALAYFMAEHTELSTMYVVNVLDGALLFVAGAGLLATFSDFQKFFRVLSCAALVLCALGMVWGGSMNGRFALRSGLDGDPNYYAMALLGIAPIVWVSFASNPWWIRMGGWLATALTLFLTLRTVSRGGFVAIFAMLFVLFFFASFKARIVMASAAVLGLVILLAFLPESMRTRLASAARISSEAPNAAIDSVSVESRQTMLMTSVNMTLNNPGLGVGPGNFGPAVAEIGRLQGFNWINLNTHNSYTQISSETGLPGVLLYLLLIGFSLKSLIETLRRTSARGTNANVEIHRLSAGLLVSIAATCTCMFFLSEGYGVMQYLWFGLANGTKLLMPPDDDDEGEYVEVDTELAS